jgi:hypothetical protein
VCGPGDCSLCSEYISAQPDASWHLHRSVCPSPRAASAALLGYAQQHKVVLLHFTDDLADDVADVCHDVTGTLCYTLTTAIAKYDYTRSNLLASVHEVGIIQWNCAQRSEKDGAVSFHTQ